jgi:hypothetical protein
MKTCSKCDETKPFEQFPRRNTKSGYRGVCKECRNNEKKKQYKPGQRRDLHLRATYGITLEQFDRLLEDQHGKCANTECRNDATVVDHNHQTGEVRGLLCNGCNTAAGLAQDNPIVLRGLANYLENRGHYG